MAASSSGDLASPSGGASKASKASKASEAQRAKPAPVLTRLVGHQGRLHCDRVAQWQLSESVPMETKIVTRVDCKLDLDDADGRAALAIVALCRVELFRQWCFVQAVVLCSGIGALFRHCGEVH